MTTKADGQLVSLHIPRSLARRVKAHAALLDMTQGQYASEILERYLLADVPSPGMTRAQYESEVLEVLERPRPSPGLSATGTAPASSVDPEAR